MLVMSKSYKQRANIRHSNKTSFLTRVRSFKNRYFLFLIANTFVTYLFTLSISRNKTEIVAYSLYINFINATHYIFIYFWTVIQLYLCIISVCKCRYFARNILFKRAESKQQLLSICGNIIFAKKDLHCKYFNF